MKNNQISNSQALFEASRDALGVYVYMDNAPSTTTSLRLGIITT